MLLKRFWVAVKHAITALVMRILGEFAPSKGVSRRSFVKNVFVKAGLSVEDASKWASYYIRC